MAKIGIKSAALSLGCAFVMGASGASAQTCRTSLSTGMMVCDNGATARTSPVAGTTTFSDGRTARTDPATGTTRFSDGTSFRTVPVETRSTIAPAPAPTAQVLPVPGERKPAAAEQPGQRKKPALRKRPAASKRGPVR